MKKITFSILAFLIVTFTSKAQTLSWVKQLEGSTDITSISVAVDASGNVYTTGEFHGTVDFDPGVETFYLSASATFWESDIFISKVDASGNFVWAKQIGGPIADDYSNSIALDAFGNIYICGEFYGTVDFDPGVETFNLTSSTKNGFISKLDASGNFVWAKHMEGVSDVLCKDIVIDASGYVYVSGFFETNLDADPGVNIVSFTYQAGYEYICKLDGAGDFVWAKQMVATGNQQGRSIATDGLGNVFIGGSFDNSFDFDPGVGTVDLVSAGSNDVFIRKFDGSGNFVWAKQLGGIGEDILNEIVLDASGNVLITGSFSDNADFNPAIEVYNLTSNGESDIFICKLNGSGNLVWATRLGGTLIDRGNAIAVDASDNVYTTGIFNGAIDFNLVSVSYIDIFICKMDGSGNFVWAHQIGGTSEDTGEESTSIVVDAFDNVYTTGYFLGTVDFGPGEATVNLTAEGLDLFIHKMYQCPPLLSVLAPGDVTFCGNTVKLTGATVSNNNPFLWEYVSGTTVSIQPDANAKEPTIVFPAASAGSVTLRLRTPGCSISDDVIINQTSTGLPVASIAQSTLITAATSNINFNPSINGIVNWNVSGTGSVATSAPYNYQPSAQDILDGAVEIVANVQGTGACSAYYASDTIRITLTSGSGLYSMSGSITNAALTTQSTFQVFKKLNAYWVLFKDTLVNNSSYTIPGLTNGEYKIFAITSDIERIPTYYGNVTRWADASTITVSNGNATGLNINLQQYTISAADLLEYLNGSNRVAGRVTLNTTGTLSNLKTQVDPSNIKPVENATVILYDNTGTTKLISDQTNNNGFYIIDGMQPSQVQIEAEYPGTVLEGTTVTNPEQKQNFVIVEGADNVKNIQLVKIDDASLNKLTAAEKGIDVSETSRLLFPNPAASVVYIRLPETMKKSGNYKLIVFNNAGVPVETSNYEPAADVLQFDISGLKNGIYYLYLTSGTESVKEKLVVE